MRLLAPLLALAMLAGSLSAVGRKTATSRGKLLADDPVAVATIAPTDSVVAAAAGAFTVSGYDKPLRSRKESMFVTSRGGADVTALRFTVGYTDMDGRQLHRRSLWVDADIPSGQTRRVAFPSWDGQLTFYYYRSRPSRASGAPYKVAVSIDSVRVK